MKKILLSIFVCFILGSCTSTKFTIKNINDDIPGPALNEALGSFVITRMATSSDYAYNKDYPVNVGFTSLADGVNNQKRYLNALAGPNGEAITYTLKSTCCPFPTKKTDAGAGMIDIYEIVWKGQKKPILLHINKYERGELLIPVGLSKKN
jgi:hypothetical protein